MNQWGGKHDRDRPPDCCGRCLVPFAEAAPPVVVQASDVAAPTCETCTSHGVRWDVGRAHPPESFRWYFAWHPRAEFCVVRPKNAEGFEDWRERAWRDFPSRPEICDVTEAVGALIASVALGRTAIKEFTRKVEKAQRRRGLLGSLDLTMRQRVREQAALEGIAPDDLIRRAVYTLVGR